jgi:hypothetical protein
MVYNNTRCTLRHLAASYSAIDNATRALINRGQTPVTCGLWFSLGHSTIVIAVVRSDSVVQYCIHSLRWLRTSPLPSALLCSRRCSTSVVLAESLVSIRILHRLNFFLYLIAPRYERQRLFPLSRRRCQHYRRGQAVASASCSK